MQCEQNYQVDIVRFSVSIKQGYLNTILLKTCLPYGEYYFVLGLGPIDLNRYNTGTPLAVVNSSDRGELTSLRLEYL